MGEFFSFEQRMERYRSLLDVPEEMIFFFEPDGYVCERNHLVTNQLEYEEDEALFIQEIFPSVFELEDGRVKLAGKPEKERFETAEIGRASCRERV